MNKSEMSTAPTSVGAVDYNNVVNIKGCGSVISIILEYVNCVA